MKSHQDSVYHKSDQTEFNESLCENRLDLLFKCVCVEMTLESLRYCVLELHWYNPHLWYKMQVLWDYVTLYLWFMIYTLHVYSLSTCPNYNLLPTHV